MGCANGHCFCSVCIHEWLPENKQDDLLCPQCEPSKEAKSMSKKKKVAHFGPNLALTSVLQRLTVRCPTLLEPKDSAEDERACGWQGPLHERLAHTAICSFVKVPCSSAGCHATVARMNMPAHQAVCPHRVIACDYCDEDVVVQEMSSHLLECELAPVKCGCGVTFARRSLPLHQEACPDCEVPCPFAKFGCTTLVARRDMAQHEQEAAVKHAALMQAAMAQHDLTQVVEKLLKQVASVKKDVAYIKHNIEKLPIRAPKAAATKASKAGGGLEEKKGGESEEEEEETEPRKRTRSSRKRPRSASLPAKEKIAVAKGGKRVSVRYFVDPDKPARVKAWTIGPKRTKTEALTAAKEFLDKLHSQRTGVRFKSFGQS